MRNLLLILLFATLSACHWQPRAPDGTTVSLDDFRGLKWIEGKWIGSGTDSSLFAESYEYLDDSTIISRTWSDTSFAQVSDSSFLSLRHGGVTSGSGDFRWVLARWDRTGLHFEPRGKAGNAFVWFQESASSWTATLTWNDAEGKPQKRVYLMRRYQL